MALERSEAKLQEERELERQFARAEEDEARANQTLADQKIAQINALRLKVADPDAAPVDVEEDAHKMELIRNLIQALDSN